mgnify:CR=1 FL=1
MPQQDLHIVIMAAGKGTRMKSAQSKVLQKIAGKPLLLHVLATAQALHAAQAVVITGHKTEILSSDWCKYDQVNCWRC